MVLVTGGSGFIGARLVERLAHDKIPVHALVHRLGTPGSARVAALAGVTLIHGDVSDTATVGDAARGCEVIVHCAVDTKSAPGVQERVTTAGAEAVLDAARAHGVRRIVHLSTAAVYSWTAPGTWDEDAPIRPRDVYTRSKRASEEFLLANRDVPVTVLRPTCVYGPFSRTWTESPIEFMRLGIPIVSEDNRERANVIYIDNLVDLIVAASKAADREHHVYIATDDQPHDWETLFSAYARTLGLPLLRYRPATTALGVWQDEIAVSIANARVLLGRVFSDVKRPLVQDLITLQRHVPLLQRVRGLVPARVISNMSAAARKPAVNGHAAVPAGNGRDRAIRPFASMMIRKQYGARATFTAARARRELGWTPRIGPAEAIERTCAWIAYAGL